MSEKIREEAKDAELDMTYDDGIRFMHCDPLVDQLFHQMAKAHLGTAKERDMSRYLNSLRRDMEKKDE